MGYAFILKSGVGDLWVDSCRHSKSEISINHKKFIYMYDSIVIEPKEGPYFYQCKWDSQVVEIMEPQE